MDQMSLIEIRQGRAGFDPFIGSWLIQGQYTMVVDVGPASTAEQLISELEAREVFQLDYILDELKD